MLVPDNQALNTRTDVALDSFDNEGEHRES